MRFEGRRVSRSKTEPNTAFKGEFIESSSVFDSPGGRKGIGQNARETGQNAAQVFLGGTP
jgi:hypothetical protein